MHICYKPIFRKDIKRLYIYNFLNLIEPLRRMNIKILSELNHLK